MALGQIICQVDNLSNFNPNFPSSDYNAMHLIAMGPDAQNPGAGPGLLEPLRITLG